MNYKSIKKSLLCMAMAMATALTVNAGATMTVEPIELTPGTTSAQLDILLENDEPLRDFQLDLDLPQGVTIDLNSRGKLDFRVTYRTAYHTLTSRDCGDGHYRLVGVNLEGDQITVGSGAIVTAQLAIDPEIAVGNYQMKLYAVRVSRNDGSEVVQTEPYYSDFVIKAQSVNPQSITIEPTSLSLKVGESRKIGATVLPAETTDKTVTWKSSDISVAKVDANGLVEAVSAGTTSITATCGSVSARCEVTVSPAPPLVEPGYEFTVEQGSIRRGRLNMVPVLAENVQPIVAFQCDITLPDGLALRKDENGEIAFSLSERAARTHVIASDMNGRTTRIIVYSMKNEEFTGSQGPLFSIPFEVAGEAEQYSFDITNILVTVQDRSEKRFPDLLHTFTILPNYIAGDANGDNSVSASDIVTVVDYLLHGSAHNFVFEAADINEDGSISANDVVGILDVVLSSIPNTPAIQKVMAKAQPAEPGNTLTVAAASGVTGTKISLPVDMTSSKQIIAFQCDMTFPEGITIPEDTDGDLEITLTDRKVDHTVSAAKSPGTENTYRMIVFSMKNRPISDLSGVLFNVMVDLGVDPGTYNYTFSNILVTDIDRVETLWPEFNGSITVLPVPVSSVTLNKTELSIVVGNSETLVPTVSPENAADKTVTWTSDNEAVATVDAEGKVTAVAVGNATITATCGDVSATCAVKVLPVEAESVTLNKTELTLIAGESETLVATVMPENTSDKTVTWASDNEAVATVDAKGNVTAVAGGTATITAKCGSKSATCTVTVEKKSQEIIWTQTFDEVKVSQAITLEAKASSGLDVTFTITKGADLASLEDNRLAILNEGEIEVTAMQAGDSVWLAAPIVTKTITAYSGIESVTAAAVKISVEAGELVIAGLDANSVVNVYTASGLLLYSGTDRRIPLSQGLYIVRVGEISTKVRI